MEDFVEVARMEDLSEKTGVEVKVGPHRVGLFLIEGEIYAIGNDCPHRGGPLHEGILDGCEVSCPWHAWTFDVTNGRCTFIDGLSVPTFPVKVKDGRVFVREAPDITAPQ